MGPLALEHSKDKYFFHLVSVCILANILLVIVICEKTSTHQSRFMHVSIGVIMGQSAQNARANFLFQSSPAVKEVIFKGPTLFPAQT